MQQLKQLAVQKSTESRTRPLTEYQREQNRRALRWHRDQVVASDQIPAVRLKALLQACLDDWCFKRGLGGGLLLQKLSHRLW